MLFWRLSQTARENPPALFKHDQSAKAAAMDKVVYKAATKRAALARIDRLKQDIAAYGHASMMWSKSWRFKPLFGDHVFHQQLTAPQLARGFMLSPIVRDAVQSIAKKHGFYADMIDGERLSFTDPMWSPYVLDADGYLRRTSDD